MVDYLLKFLRKEANFFKLFLKIILEILRILRYQLRFHSKKVFFL